MMDELGDFSMKFDDLDLSFEADQHELDSCCLPNLMAESFASSSIDSRDDDDSEVTTFMMNGERMDVDGDHDDDSVRAWETVLQEGGQMGTQQDIHWDPSSVVQHTTDSLPNATSTSYGQKDIEWVPPRPLYTASTSTRSLQEEYERSRKKLVASMMRSRETRRYVEQWKQQRSLPDLRDEMMKALGDNLTER